MTILQYTVLISFHTSIYLIRRIENGQEGTVLLSDRRRVASGNLPNPLDFRSPSTCLQSRSSAFVLILPLVIPHSATVGSIMLKIRIRGNLGVRGLIHQICVHPVRDKCLYGGKQRTNIGSECIPCRRPDHDRPQSITAES